MELAASCALGQELPDSYPLTDGAYYWVLQEIMTFKEN